MLPLKYSDKKNSLWLSIRYLTILIFSLLTLKLNILNFGKELFGIWLLFSAFWGIGSVIDFGFGTAIIKYIAEADNRNDNREINIIISTSYLIFFILGFFLFIAGTTGGYLIYFTNANIIKPEYFIYFLFVFIVLGLSSYARYISIFFKSIFEGFQNFVIPSKFGIVNASLIFLSVVLVYFFNGSLIILALSYFVSNLVILFLQYFYLKRYYSSIQFKLSFIELSKVKPLFKFSISVQFATLIGSLIDPVIKYLIGNFIALDTVTYYEIARRFATAISGLFATAFRTILPKASILKTKEDIYKYINLEGINITRMSIAYSGIAYGCLSFLIIGIIKLWFGYNQSVLLYLILLLPETINNFGYFNYMLLIGIGKASKIVIVQSLNIILIWISVITGIYLFKGYLGLFGYLIAEVIVNIFILSFVKKYSSMSIINYLKKVRIYKLFFLSVIVVLALLAILIYNLNILIISIMLSLISFSIFYSELKEYGRSFIRNMTFVK